jgi:hypothetical protein
MCRNIRVLHNFEPPTTKEEIHAAALQYVRKVSGMQKPAQAEQEAFDGAVGEIARATERLIGSLKTRLPPRDRELERQKGRERWKQREARLQRP